MTISGESGLINHDRSHLADEGDDVQGHVRFDQLIIRFDDHPRAPVSVQVLSPWGEETDPKRWVF